MVGGVRLGRRKRKRELSPPRPPTFTMRGCRTFTYLHQKRHCTHSNNKRVLSMPLERVDWIDAHCMRACLLEWQNARLATRESFCLPPRRKPCKRHCPWRRNRTGDKRHPSRVELRSIQPKKTRRQRRTLAMQETIAMALVRMNQTRKCDCIEAIVVTAYSRVSPFSQHTLITTSGTFVGLWNGHFRRCRLGSCQKVVWWRQYQTGSLARVLTFLQTRPRTDNATSGSIASMMERDLEQGLDDPFDERAIVSKDEMEEWEKEWNDDMSIQNRCRWWCLYEQKRLRHCSRVNRPWNTCSKSVRRQTVFIY